METCPINSPVIVAPCPVSQRPTCRPGSMYHVVVCRFRCSKLIGGCNIFGRHKKNRVCPYKTQGVKNCDEVLSIKIVLYAEYDNNGLFRLMRRSS